MNDQKREIIEQLYNLWHKEPELRLGQLLWAAFDGTDYFYFTDEEFIKKIEYRFENRNQDQAE